MFLLLTVKYFFQSRFRSLSTKTAN
jgi:hypothetical protein